MFQNLVISALKFLLGALVFAITAVSLFAYVFQIKDQFGYAMDGVATTVVIAGTWFAYGLHLWSER